MIQQKIPQYLNHLLKFFLGVAISVYIFELHKEALEREYNKMLRLCVARLKTKALS